MNSSILDCLFAHRVALSVVVALMLSACSGDEEPKVSAEEQKTDHVWKEQTQAIDKARDVGRLLGEAAARQEKAAQRAAQ